MSFPLQFNYILQFGVGFNVANRAFEPFAGVDDPPKENKREHHAQSNGGIIEGLKLDGILSGQQEDRTSVTYPQERHQANGATKSAQEKWARLEL